MLGPRDDGIPAVDAGVLRRSLGEIWQSLLGRDLPSGEDNFFELGGDSLLAVQFAVRVREQIGLDAPLDAVLRGPTIDELVELLDAVAEYTPPLPAAVPPARRRASVAQENVLQSAHPVFLVVSSALRVSGPLELDRLDHAIELVARRHESLRTFFVADAGVYYQEISEHARPTLSVDNLAAEYEAHGTAAIDRWLRERANVSFDPGCPSLVRASFARLGPDECLLVFVAMHLICDGWGIAVLLSEISDAYERPEFYHETTRSQPRMTAADWSDAHRLLVEGPRGRDILAAWRARLGDDPEFLREPFPGYFGRASPGAPPKHERMSLTGDIDRGLRDFARRERVTLFAVLAGAFALAVHEVSGIELVVMQTSFANRRGLKEEKLIAWCSGSIYLPIVVTGGVDLATVARVAHAAITESTALAGIPSWLLARRLWPDGTGSSKFPMLYVALTKPETSAFAVGGTTVTPVEMPTAPTISGLSLRGDDFGNSIVIDAIFPEGDFADDAVRNLLSCLERCIKNQTARPAGLW